MKIHSSNLTQEIEVLQNKYNSAVASRDELQLELDRLKRNDTGEKLKHVIELDFCFAVQCYKKVFMWRFGQILKVMKCMQIEFSAIQY